MPQGSVPSNSEHLVFPQGHSIDAFLSSQLCQPFSDIVIDMLGQLSAELLSLEEADAGELRALGFWFRPGKVAALRDYFTQLHSAHNAYPLGTVFQIAPGNSEIQFMYSTLLALILGNRVAVRLSRRESTQVRRLFDVLETICKQEQFADIQQRLFFFRSEHDSVWLKDFSNACDLRMIWGGDESIKAVRRIELNAKAKDLSFSDRASIALVNSASLAEEDSLERFVERFLRDVLTFQQQACSSPLMLYFVGSDIENQTAQTGFEEVLGRYYEGLSQAEHNNDFNTSFDNSDAADFVAQQSNAQKLCALLSCECKVVGPLHCLYLKAGETLRVEHLIQHSGRGVLLIDSKPDLNTLMADLNALLSETIPFNSTLQTLTYFGYTKDLIDDSLTLDAQGIFDRIETTGKALDFHYIWDGYNFLHEFCRITHK